MEQHSLIGEEKSLAGTDRTKHRTEQFNKNERLFAMSDDEIKLYDVRTNAEWQRLGFTAENRPPISVRPSDVPEAFRSLISFVERWAISCDVTRGDYFSKQPQADVDAFYQAVLPHLDALNQWVDTPPRSDAKLDFLIMLKAHCEAAPPPSPEEITETHRRRASEREAKRKYWKDVYQRTKKTDA